MWTNNTDPIKHWSKRYSPNKDMLTKDNDLIKTLTEDIGITKTW